MTLKINPGVRLREFVSQESLSHQLALLKATKNNPSLSKSVIEPGSSLGK